jgi:SAM-dependent methyltransferase
VCSECYLVQLAEFETPEQIFGDYAYFSSFSRSWLEHARTYVEQTSARFDLGPSNQIVEIASNDGYLLQYFVERELPVLGIEPAANVAAAAQERGIPTLVEFFGTELATRLRDEGTTADLLLGNNVLAHVPDLNDFVGGMATLLSADGVITMEFPHLLQLMRHNQFDTIYHEHFSYFSFLTVSAVFAHHGVRLFDVEEIPTHGGSLRIYGCHADNAAHVTTDRAQQLLAVEREAGLDRLSGYSAFPEQVRQTKRTLVRFLLDAKESGATIAAYGAPAKGNTLLNYAGVGTDVIDFTVDRSPHKQGFALPGTRIPIFAPEHVFEAKPDYLLVLPWNLRDEIIEDMGAIRDWGGRFVFPIPEVSVVD